MKKYIKVNANIIAAILCGVAGVMNIYEKDYFMLVLFILLTCVNMYLGLTRKK